jgi:hypothetical protein
LTREDLGTLTAIRNLLHGAPTSQALLARRLRDLDELLAREWSAIGNDRFTRFLDGRRIDYAPRAGRILDQLGQRR